MTFEELIGKDTKQDERISEFPPYEEFQKSSDEARLAREEARGYNDGNNRPTENVRNFPNSSSNGYGYTAYDSFSASVKDEPRRYDNGQRGDYNAPYGASGAETTRPVFSSQNRTAVREDTGLLRYTEEDTERLSEEELSAKLSYSNERTRQSGSTVNAENARIGATDKKTEPAGRGAAVRTHAHLSAKGKLVLVSYIAVIITVAVLIIVNAGNLNAGKAITPSSSVSYSQGAEI